MFCAKLHAFNLLKKIIVGLSLNKHKTEEGKIEMIRLALSMNIGTTRKPERIKTIYSALGITKELYLVPNTINSVETPLTDDVIAGIIDGDGSFWVSFLFLIN